MKDNIHFFGQELKKTSEGTKKIKEYNYYIEHMYGKRGKKTDYNPWSCNKVANKNIPSEGDYYGCPFKYYSREFLKIALKNQNQDLTEEEID